MSAPRTRRPIVLAMTGASGAAYAIRLLQCLVDQATDVHLLISPSGSAVIAQETGIHLEPTKPNIGALLRYHWPTSPGQPATQWTAWDESLVTQGLGRITFHDYRDYMTPIASGSFLTSGMVVCPCSGATLSGVVHAAGNNLIQRAADVHLKEHRKLILMPRETPLSVFQLENMHRAAQAGAIVLPAMPGWYHPINSVVDLIDFVVARILDHLEIDHNLMQRWGAGNPGIDAIHRQTGDA